MLGRKELAVRLPPALVEVWKELQPEVVYLTGMAGLQIIREVIEDEVARRVRPRHHPATVAGCVRWGQQPSYVLFGGQCLYVES